MAVRLSVSGEALAATTSHWFVPSGSLELIVVSSSGPAQPPLRAVSPLGQTATEVPVVSGLIDVAGPSTTVRLLALIVPCGPAAPAAPALRPVLCSRAVP